ncbi:MAG TPA: hypothetical protein VI564_00375 [Candidatus Nanoarchaeia archaeon]|nr:hypothetical protein [Candidatus Nanoarchaeia archaeon]
MRNLVKRLEKKGWENKDIAKAVGIISNAKSEKTKENSFLQERMYIMLLLLITAANFIISAALIPIFMALSGIFLYVTIIVVGAGFGFLFELVIRGMEHLERRHHIILAFVIPIVSLVNAFIISRISNEIMRVLGLKNLHEPMLVSMVYSVAFVMPYFFYRFVLQIEYYSAK